MYIAQDAHASKCTYKKLVELEKYGNVPQNAVPGLPVVIYQEGGQKIIAYGTWSSLNSEENAVIDNIALQNSDKILPIEVQKVSVPGAIIESHKNQALKDFGPPPFTLICTRKQVHVSVIQEIESDEATQETVALEMPINDIQLDDETPSLTDNSWTADADLEVDHNAPPEKSAQDAEKDPISTQISNKVLTDPQKNPVSSARLICSRVLLDP